MGSYEVWESVKNFNERSVLGKVVVNPPDKVPADHINLYKTNEVWNICVCGRAFSCNQKYFQHKESHPKDFSVTWTPPPIKYQQLDYAAEITIMSHKCMHCGKVLGSAIALRNHIYIHTNEKPWQCDKCNAVFRLYSTLYDHKKVSHVKSGQYKCDECTCCFAASLGLKRHKGIYHSKVNLDAITMNSSKNSNKVSNEALKPSKGRVTVTVVTEDGTRTYPCHYCGKVFYKSQYLRNHYPVHTNERKNKCNLCGAGFKSSSNLLSHKKVSHVENGKYRCERCVCCFNSLLGLVRHRRLLHNIGKSGLITQTLKRVKQIKPPVKTRRLPSRVQIQTGNDYEEEEEDDDEEEEQNTKGTENSNEEEDEDGNHECRQCGKVLASAFGLKNHELIHSGEKPWKCLLCPATFRLNSTLHGHKKTSHVPNGQYKCTKCSCTFAAKFGLRRHIICFHGALPTSGRIVTTFKNNKTKGKVLKCQHCGILFRNLALLNRHVLTHVQSSGSRARPFKCPYNCDCTYISRRSLRKHEKTAHVPNGIECTSCSCSFRTAQQLKSHHTKMHIKPTNSTSLRHPQDRFPRQASATNDHDDDEEEDDEEDEKDSDEENQIEDEGLESINNDIDEEDDENEEDGQTSTSFTCPTCGKSFSSKPNFRQHLRIHSGQRYDCDLCHESFTLQSNMIRHKRSCHVPNGPYKCSECTHCYATTKGFKRHFAQAHGKFSGRKPKNRAFALPSISSSSSAINRIIQKSKMRLGVLGARKRRPYQKIPKSLHKYTCHLCQNTFSSNGNYKKHMMSSHVPNGKFKCTQCSCCFTTYNALNSHMGQRHSLRAQERDKRGQKKNVNDADNDGDDDDDNAENDDDYEDYDDPSAMMEVTYHKPASLQSSQRTSNYSTARHQQTSGKIKLNFQKSATSQPPPQKKPQTKLMAKFIKLIRGDSPPRDDDDDDENDSASFNSTNLDENVSETPSKKYTSSTTTTTISRLGRKNNNSTTTTSSTLSSSQIITKSGPQICRQCGKRFINYHTLKAHLSVHTGERPFKCDQCVQSFRQKGDIVSHKKTNHVPGGKFPCQLCACRFISGQGFKRHMAFIHGSAQNQSSSSSSSNNNNNSTSQSIYGKDRFKAEPPKVEKPNPPQHNKVTLKFSNTKKTTVPQTRMYKCELCNAAFNFAQNLTRHQKTSHVPWGEHKCLKCTCSFTSATSLRTHDAVFHQADKRTERKVVSSSSILNEEKKKSSSSPSSSNFHSTQVTSDRVPQVVRRGNKKYFLCNLCGASFQSNANCSSHISSSHVPNGQYSCQQCTCSFSTFKGLKRHEGIYHNSNSKSTKFQVLAHPIETERQTRKRRNVNYEDDEVYHQDDYYDQGENDGDLMNQEGFDDYNEDDIQDGNLEVYIDNAEADEEEDDVVLGGIRNNNKRKELEMYDDGFEGEELDEEEEREKQLESFGRNQHFLTNDIGGNSSSSRNINNRRKYHQSKQQQLQLHQKFDMYDDEEEECLEFRNIPMNPTTAEDDPLDTSLGTNIQNEQDQDIEPQHNNNYEVDPLQMPTSVSNSSNPMGHVRLTKREILDVEIDNVDIEEHDPFSTLSTQTVRDAAKSIEDSSTQIFDQRYKILSTQGGGGGVGTSHVFGGKSSGSSVNGFQKRINRFIPYSNPKEKEPTMYTCNLCFETFHHQSALRSHMRVHTDRTIQIKFDNSC